MRMMRLELFHWVRQLPATMGEVGGGIWRRGLITDLGIELVGDSVP